MTLNSPVIRTHEFIKSKEQSFSVDFDKRRRGLEQLCRLCELDVSNSQTLFDMFERPEQIYAHLERSGIAEKKVHLVGSIERRIALVDTGNKIGVGIVFGDYDADALPDFIAQGMSDIVTLSDVQFSFIANNATFFADIARPHVFLAALYHPENFPLPRFSLAISDLARSARLAGATRVEMRDMQLGDTTEEIAQEIIRASPDILGISATFGQHDVLEELMEKLPASVLDNLLLVFGGSLSVLNCDVLLDKYPKCVVATGAGETTVEGLVNVVRGRCSLSDVIGIAYRDADNATKLTRRFGPRETDEMLPELDLLQDTFMKSGVIQLESSRGCTYACSFCPREHKGIWSGDDPVVFNTVIPDIDRIMTRFPKIDRRVFLVDEEFVGYRPDGQSEQRVLAVAEHLFQNDLRFETSSRADQVYRRNKNDEWHFGRIDMWRSLVEKGLDRCLFGIESGVDEVLVRFNKKTTSDQNSSAIRMLTLLGVPPRFTYITFDPLMTFDDLVATCCYQARTDLTLRQTSDLSHEEILDIATQDELAKDYSDGRPFYEQISYMLVSIECLKNAPYTVAVKNAGHLHDFNANMGRYESSYMDSDIGLFSEHSQRWIDRTFSLDYLLKSIEKYVAREQKSQVRQLRIVIKQFAFELLRCFISLRDKDCVSDLHRSVAYLEPFPEQVERFATLDEASKRAVLLEIMDRHFDTMRNVMGQTIHAASDKMEITERNRINSQFQEWAQRTSWNLINGD